MLIATLSYCKREIIPLQRIVSATKSNVSRKMVFIFWPFDTLVWVSTDTGLDQPTHCCVKLLKPAEPLWE